MNKSLEDVQREQIDRVLARIEVYRIENDALREAVAAKDMEVREWQHLAVELGAFAMVGKDKSRMTLDCSLKIDAGLLSQAKSRTALITALVSDWIIRPMVAECDRKWGVA